MAPYERCAGFVLLRELGRDALGSVHRAGHLTGGAIDRLVLLRKLRIEDLPATAIADTAARREALSRSVRTPYLGELVELGTCAGEAFAAYDYQSGVTGRQLLGLADDRLSPLAPDLAVVIVDRVAQALTALWTMGGAGHGLMVPELVWISTEGEVRLLGAEAGPALRRAAGHPDLVPFVAPEARAGDAVSEADEVWALGALLAALLTGGAPEPDSGGAWLARAALAEDGSPLPEPIAELLGRSLVPRPQRLARVEAWHQGLTRALELVGWRPASFELAVYMHSLLKSEMKRETAELERERDEALGPVVPGVTGVAAPEAVAATALPPLARAAANGRAARPGAAASRPAGPSGPAEETEERRRRSWLPWAAAAGLAIAGGAAWFLVGRDGDPPRAARQAPTPAPATAARPGPVPSISASPALAPPASADLEQRLAQILAEREKSLSDRYSREVEQLRTQLAESRRAAAAAATPRPPLTAGRREPAQAEAVPADAARADAAGAGGTPPPGLSQEKTSAVPSGAAPAPSDSRGAPTAAEPARAAAEPPTASGPLVPPRLLRFDPPEYPNLARQRGVEGTVVLSVRVAASGQVSEVRFVRRVPQDVGINEAAAAAARRARFQPATRGGVPAEAWYTLTIPFQL